MKKIYLITLLSALCSVAFAQLGVNFTSAVANTTSSTVDIDVTVDGWDQLISTQFSINWDPNVFEFESIENVTTDLAEFSLNGNIGTPSSAQAVNEGQLTVSWSLSSTLPASLADNTRLFSMRLKAVGSNGDETTLSITDIPRVTEVINADKNDIGAVATGGNLSIDDGTTNENCVDLAIEDLTGAAGTNICVPIKVTKFNGIASVQTGLTWNSSILRYTGINEVGVSGVSTNDAAADDGELRLLWLIGLGDDPVTLADGTTIFEVCFDVIGSDRQSTNIRFESLPNFNIEVANGDGGAEEVCTDNGRFQVDGGDVQPEVGVGLIAGNVATNGASSICVPITTKNFNSIASIQSGVNWDESILSYTGIEDGAISGITVNASDAGNGSLRLLWIIGLGDDPKTVGDDEVLFELCFDVVGTNGEISPIEFASLPNFAIEIANGDGMSEEFFTRAGQVIIGNDDINPPPMNGVGLIAGDACTGNATSVCVPVTTRNFNSIASIQTGMTWDESLFTFNEIKEGALTGITVNSASADQGNLRLLWIIGLGDDPLTLPDDEVLFEICFDAIGNDGDKSVVGFMDLPNFAIEIANGDGMAEEFFTNDGSACIGDKPPVGGTACPDGLGSDLALYVATTTVEEGEEVCVPIQVGNFSDVQSMQITLQWDASVLEYVRQDNFGLPDLGNANYNFISPDKLRVSWTPLSSPSTLADCSTIFEVCFNAIGSCADAPSSPIQIISDGNVLIELTNGNNDVIDVDIFSGTVSINECTQDPNITISEKSDISCVGEMDGAVVVDAMGTGGVTCEWTNADGDVVGSDCNLMGVSEGTYTLTATNGLGNTSTRSVTIAGADMIAVTVDVTNRDCDTESAFSVNASGGTSANGTYTYSYDGPVDLDSESMQSAIPGGTYTVTVIDDNGCEMSETFMVLDSSIIVDAQVANISSIEGDDGGIIIAASSSGGDIAYAWADGPTSADRQGLTPGTYTVTISDAAGCSSVRVFELDWEAVFVNNIVTESSTRYNGFGISCPGDDNGMLSGAIVGGCDDGPVVFTVNGEEATLPLTVSAGTYVVRATDACGNTDEETISISAPDPIMIMERTDLQDGCASPGSSNGQINLGLSGGAGDYIITTSVGTVNGQVIEDLPEGMVTVTVEDANGCQVLLENLVVEECLGPVTCNATTIISPNSDGVNDNLVFDCLMRSGLEPNKLGVYNRWGELVFEMENYDNSWSGMDMSGVDLDEGGYMWILKISRPDQPVELFRGTVTLLRSL